MEFCPKCGSIILVKEGKAACAKCGHKPKGRVKIEASEKVEKKLGVAVINEKQSNTYPIVKMKCSECGNKEAYFWTMQTRASDESETKFYRCTKCEHTWRVYR
jgi:transcription factor S